MEDFIEGFGITQNKLAVPIGVPPCRIDEIAHGKRGITADTAIRLARYFGASEDFWMNLQSNYELWLERRALRDKVAAITSLKVSSRQSRTSLRSRASRCRRSVSSRGERSWSSSCRCAG